MRNVIYSMMMSLDEYIAGPNGELDWPIIDEELHTFANDWERRVDTHLYGRRMYELMADFWPTADADPSAPAYIVEFARLWRDMPKVVFSKTLDEVRWNATLNRGDVAEEVARLKRLPGKDISIGGAAIASSLMRHGLIDEYHLYVHPVVLGGGVRAFQGPETAATLRLVDTRTFRSGVVFLRYQRSGEGR